MELTDALRTTAAVREFTDEPVAPEALARVLDTARFAPSGGNRQGWRVVVVEDPALRRSLRDLYLPGWYDYLAMASAGLTPWAPITDRAAETEALTRVASVTEAAAGAPGGFAEHLDEVPVLLALLVDLRDLAAVDRDHDRYTFAGGASVYPFAWNLLLAAREEGLGGVITTMAIREEAGVREVLGAPDEMALAALVALGHPVHQPRRLRRAPVAQFVTVDRVDGAPFGAGG
ncbi:MAG TPA: nitroreductase family protein [Acidimicrobiales bacterium]|nr:nitroreductase family protein [Acidimicrobiales bacterium]